MLGNLRKLFRYRVLIQSLVVRELKADARTRNIPVVMVTTQSNDNIMKECFQAGCAEYVMKPINKCELMSKVRNLTAARQNHFATYGQTGAASEWRAHS